MYKKVLKAGTYDVCWYSTTTGNIVKTENQFTLSTDGSKTFTAPDFSANTDIVLNVKKVSTSSEILLDEDFNDGTANNWTASTNNGY